MRQNKPISATILMLLALVLGACSTGQDEATVPEASIAPVPVIEVSPSPMMEPSPSPMMEPNPAVAGAMDATLAEITANPEAYVEQTVTVEGGVNTVQGETSFTIADNTLTDLGEVLVVNAMQQPLDMALQAREPVRVTGTVRNFEIADINRDLNLNLDPETYRDFDNKPVLIASSVEVIEGAADGQMGNRLTVADITGQSEAYVGQMVTVRGPIESVIGMTALSLDEDAATAGGIDNELLIVSGKRDTFQLTEENEGETVEVMGMVRTFDTIANVEQEIGYELDQNLVSPYVGRPVIVAQSVRLIDEASAGEWNATAPTEAAIGAEATATAEMDGAEAAAALTVAELTSNVERYLDQPVNVRSDVNNVIGPDAFVLDEDAPFDGGIDRDLLVISGTQGDVVEDGSEVEVGGVVRMFDLAQIEQMTGRDLDDAALEAYRGRPVVIANYVRAVPMFVAPDVAEAIGEADPTITERYGRNITVAEVAGNSADFLDKTVTVRGSVQEQLGQRALVLDEDAPLAGGIDNDLLVLSASQTITVTDDDLVQVNGTVRSFDLAQIEQELGADLDDALFTDYAGRPVLVAQQITINATPAAIAADPARYAGRQVAVLGEVEQVIGQGGFSLDEDALLEAGIDNDLLVIRADPSASTLDEGIESRTVQVIGTVRALITAEIERDYGITLDDEIVVEYEGRPVVVATSVQVVER